MRVLRALAMVAPGLFACQPATTRPTFTALPEAETVEVRLSPLEATRRLAEVMQELPGSICSDRGRTRERPQRWMRVRSYPPGAK